MRDSSKGSRRSLWLTTQYQELENLLQQFRTLQIGPNDSPLFQPVASIDAYHNRSNLPEVSGLDLSPLPDNNFDLSAVNQPDWLSTPPFRSLSPKLADIPTAASKETSETETTSDALFQENLADETNLSNCPERISTQLHNDGLGSRTSPPIFLLLSLLSLQVWSLRCLHPHHCPHHLILLPHRSPIFLTPLVYHFRLTWARKKTLRP